MVAATALELGATLITDDGDLLEGDLAGLQAPCAHLMYDLIAAYQAWAMTR